jgi:hypothetical protein
MIFSNSILSVSIPLAASKTKDDNEQSKVLSHPEKWVQRGY